MLWKLKEHFNRILQEHSLHLLFIKIQASLSTNQVPFPPLLTSNVTTTSILHGVSNKTENWKLLSKKGRSVSNAILFTKFRECTLYFSIHLQLKYRWLIKSFSVIAFINKFNSFARMLFTENKKLEASSKLIASTLQKLPSKRLFT